MLIFYAYLCTAISTLRTMALALAIYSHETETEIRNEILSLYDPVSRPGTETHIKTGLSVLAVDELSLKDQMLTMAGWLTFEWNDKRLRWNHTEKDGLKYIFVKPYSVWEPELIVDNALQDLSVISSDNLLMRLKYDGTVDWEIPMLFRTHCEFRSLIISAAAVSPGSFIGGEILGSTGTTNYLKQPTVDITFYPYDQQKCAVEILSWSYTIEEVQLDHLFEDVNLENLVQHGEWEVLCTDIKDKKLIEHLPGNIVRVYPQLDFYVCLERRTAFYTSNVIMPVVLMSLMICMVFIVPLDSGEKISYVLTEFLSLLVLLTIVVPPTSITLSILGLYLGVVLVMAASGIFLTVLILILFHKEGKPKKSSCIFGIAVCAAKVICWKMPYVTTKVVPVRSFPTCVNTRDKRELKGDLRRDLGEKATPVTNISKEGDVVTYQMLAQVLDRFLFYIFLIMTILTNASFIYALNSGRRSTNTIVNTH